jgi:hypothetical protein
MTNSTRYLGLDVHAEYPFSPEEVRVKKLRMDMVMMQLSCDDGRAATDA